MLPLTSPEVVIETPDVELDTTSIARPCAVTPPAAETETAPPLASLRTLMPAPVPPDEVTAPLASMLTAPPPVFRATIAVPPGDTMLPPFADCVITMPPAPDWTRVSASCVPVAVTAPSFSLKSSLVPAATDGARAPRSPVHSKTPLPKDVSVQLPGIESCRSIMEKEDCRIEN